MAAAHSLDPAMVRLNVQSFASHLSTLVDDGHRAHTQVQELKVYVNRLTLQQGLLRNERDEARVETAQCKDTIRALSTRVKELLSSNNQLTEDCNNAIKTVKEGDAKRENLEKDAHRLEEKMAKVEAELKDTKAQCLQLNEENKRLREQNKKAILSLEDVKKAHAQVSSEKTQQKLAYENGVTKMKVMDGELTKLKNENAQLQSQNKAMSHNLDSLTKEYASVKLEEDKAASLGSAKIAEMNRIIRSQKLMSEEQSKNYLALSRESEKLVKENGSLNTTMTALSDRNKGLSTELDKLKEELEEMKEHMKQMDSMVEESTQYIEKMEQKYGSL